MEIKDREFILANIHNFETVQHGYVRNLGGAMHEYERIYKTYLDPGFVLQPWCSDCVFNMIKRLAHWWGKQNITDIFKRCPNSFMPHYCDCKEGECSVTNSLQNAKVIEVDNVEEVLQANNIPLHAEKANRRRRK